jgi:hypothetical protein
LSKNVTVPSGWTGEFTVAVSVSVCPSTAVVREAPTAVEVCAGATTIASVKLLSSGGLSESCAVMVTAKVPALVGVPDNVPLEASSTSPGGRSPDATDQSTGVIPPVKVKGVGG